MEMFRLLYTIFFSLHVRTILTQCDNSVNAHGRNFPAVHATHSYHSDNAIIGQCFAPSLSFNGSGLTDLMISIFKATSN